MVGRLQLLCLAVSAGALLAPATPSRAQCRLCDSPVTQRDESETDSGIRLEVETSLNFDRLVLAGSGPGIAVLRPDGSHAATGSVADVSARAIVATVTIHGEAGRSIRLELPRRIELYSLSGGTITFDDLVSDLPSLPRLDSAGNLTVRLGGRLTVTGDAEGDYSGDLPVTAEYL